MNETTLRERREGVALATTLFMIVVIGTIISAVLFASMQEQRSSTGQLYAERALTAAEYGQNAVLIDWNRDRAWTAKNGDTTVRVYNLADGSTARAVVTKINMTTFLVASEGLAGATDQTAARRRTSVLLTLDIPQIRVPAAFTARGRDSVGGNMNATGNDTNPAGWDCPAAGPMASAIATGDSSMKYMGGSYTLTGNPPVQKTPAANDTNTYFNLGGTTYNDLTGVAGGGGGIVFDVASGATLSLSGIGPVTSGSTCVTSDVKNWGDPYRNVVSPGACESYMPIIHSRGPGTLAISGGGGGGRGQGILLVDGNLTISGNWEFHGLIIVRGRVGISGTGTKVFGGIMAANMNGGTNTIFGNPTLQFSRCALTQVLAKRAYPKPTKERAWADMY